MRFVLVLSLALLPSVAMAQMVNPFNPDSLKYAEPGRARSSSALPSTLNDVRLSGYEQQMFDNCREEAKDRGQDIMQIRNAGGFLNAPYKNPDCARFVVEKMLSSMDVAMKDDPEALAEYQRDKNAQRKYEELKKAYQVLNRNAPTMVAEPTPTQPVVKPSTNSMSATQLLSLPLEESSSVLIHKQPVPAEWWSKDYRAEDFERWQEKVAARNEIRHRAPEGEASGGSSPLKAVMDEAAQRKTQSDDNNRARMRGYSGYR